MCPPRVGGHRMLASRPENTRALRIRRNKARRDHVLRKSSVYGSKHRPDDGEERKRYQNVSFGSHLAHRVLLRRTKSSRGTSKTNPRGVKKWARKSYLNPIRTISSSNEAWRWKTSGAGRIRSRRRTYSSACSSGSRCTRRIIKRRTKRRRISGVDRNRTRIRDVRRGSHRMGTVSEADRWR